jgi:hypothetical protein
MPKGTKMNFIKSRHSRLERFAKKYVPKNGGEPMGAFMSLEAVLDNADTDIELIKLGFYDQAPKKVDYGFDVCPECKSQKLNFTNNEVECLGCGATFI